MRGASPSTGADLSHALPYARAGEIVRTRVPAARLALLIAAALSLAVLLWVALAGSGGRAGAAARPKQSARAGSFAQPLPAALAAAASSRMGASSPAYWPVHNGAALDTHGGGLAATFTAAGASVKAGAGQLQLSLASVARGRRTSAVAPASPAAQAGQVVYSRGAIVERYQAGPYGLEQSFILARRPLRGTGALSLSIRSGGDVRASSAGSQIAFRGRAGGLGLTYGALSARDALGRELPAQLRLRGATLQLVIDDSHARYPIRIDPFLQEGSKLTGGSEETGAGQLGASVALSANGETAIVGAPTDNSSAGAAWIFVRKGSTWEQQGPKLTGAEEIGKARFGFRVALSGDGNTALVGGPVDNGSKGAAWVFTRSEEKWTQQAKLLGGEEVAEGEFGIGVALSGEGNTAMVGGSGDNSGAGAVWMFTRSSEGVWTQQGAKLAGSGETGIGHLGFSVALSEDGNTALAGGGSDNANVGAAWVFTRSSEGVWTQQGAKLTGTGETGGGKFGWSVALSAEGSTAMVGGVTDNSEVGAAWVFTRSTEGVWTQQGAKLTASGEVGKGAFGASVGLNSTGSLAVIGAVNESSNVGGAWVFRRTGTTWEQFAKLTGGGESGKGHFGAAVSLSADGATALFGGSGDNGESGAAWPFSNAPLAPTVVTGNATAVTQTSATLNATVNPNGEEVTDCHFNYGTTTGYGHSAPCATSPGSGASPVPVSAAIGELAADTVYHFQIVATNATGTSEGSDQSFATPNPPEFGRCIKLAKGVKGRFANVSCTSAATAEKFEFEWEAGAGAGRKFTTTSAVTAKLETTGKKLVTCKAESGQGEVTSPKTVGLVTMTFTGCESSAAKCTTAGGAEGEISTKTLEGRLGLEKKGSTPLLNKVALDLFAAGETGPVMEFTCGSTAVIVTGSVLHPVAGNKMVSSQAVKYTEIAGKQKPERFEGMPTDVLEATFGEGAPEHMGLAASMTQVNGEKLEVNTVV